MNGDRPTGGGGSDIWPAIKSWGQKQDPNVWSIVLGQMAGAGAPEGSWQRGIGKVGASLGAGRQMAKSLEARRAESKKRWDQLLGLLGGGKAEGMAPGGGLGASGLGTSDVLSSGGLAASEGLGEGTEQGILGQLLIGEGGYNPATREERRGLGGF